MPFTGNKLSVTPNSIATLVNDTQVMTTTASGVAVTSIGPAKQVGTAVTNAMSPYNVASTDLRVDCATSGGAISVVLPSAGSSTNRVVQICDVAGSAATNNVTLTVTGGGTINGSASYVINSAYGSVTVASNGSVWFVTNRIAAAASSGPLTLIETKTLSAVNSVTFSGLDGDTQLLYFIQGQVLLNALTATARVLLRPNAASTNFKSSLIGNSTAGGGPYTSTSTSGFLVNGLFLPNGSQVAFNGYINASSTFVTNGRRTWAGVCSTYNSSGPQSDNFQTSGVWTVDAAGNNMTSLQVILDDANVTMSGSISLYRVSRT